MLRLPGVIRNDVFATHPPTSIAIDFGSCWAKTSSESCYKFQCWWNSRCASVSRCRIGRRSHCGSHNYIGEEIRETKWRCDITKINVTIAQSIFQPVIRRPYVSMAWCYCIHISPFDDLSAVMLLPMTIVASCTIAATRMSSNIVTDLSTVNFPSEPRTSHTVSGAGPFCPLTDTSAAMTWMVDEPYSSFEDSYPQ